MLRRIDDPGFDPVDVGGLDQSWRQQPGSPLHTKDFDAAGMRAGLAKAHRERAEAWRTTANIPGSFAQPA